MLQYLIPGILILISGAFEGGMDFLQFHYSGNSQFWNPKTSWTNKYKDHNPIMGKTFIGKYFVSLTDGWHLLKLFNHLFLFSSVPFLIHIHASNFTFWYCLLVIAGYWICRGFGFTAVFNLLK